MGLKLCLSLGVTAEPYNLAMGLRVCVAPSQLSRVHPEGLPLRPGLIPLGQAEVHVSLARSSLWF